MSSISISGFKCYVGGAAHCSYRTNGSSAYLGYNDSGIWAISVKFTASVTSGEKITGLNFGLCFWGVSRDVYAIISTSDNNSTYAGASGYKDGATFLSLTGGGNGDYWNYFDIDCTISSSGTYYLYLWPADKSSKSLLELYKNSGTRYDGSVLSISKKVTVSFSAGSGSGSVPSSITAYSGEYVTIDNTTPTPPADSNMESTGFTITAYNGSAIFGRHTAYKNTYQKYSFSKWSGGELEVEAGGAFYMPVSSITLTAQYTSSEVGTYSNNTLANVMASIGTPSKSYNPISIPVLLDAQTNGGECNATSVNATQTGTYVFKGWNTSDGQETGLSTSETFKNATNIYAAYELSTKINPVSLPTSGVSKESTGSTYGYTVTLNANGGTVSPTSIRSERVIKYTFLGWAKSPTSNDYITSYTPSGSNETLYAIFDNGTQTDLPVSLPSATKAGVRFMGWSENSPSGQFVPNPYLPKKSITLYANYKLGRDIKAFLFHNGKWWLVMNDSI
mgnify:CR=1 FL=1